MTIFMFFFSLIEIRKGLLALIIVHELGFGLGVTILGIPFLHFLHKKTNQSLRSNLLVENPDDCVDCVLC